ncbi:MAG TPA: GAF domain-containing protein, partial [Candidatus Binatia bacterium]|nr:GAF domain-containing protein [Candidatus Binatia bacterium]
MPPNDPSPDEGALPGLREQIAQNQQTIDRLNRDLAKKSNEVRIIQQISSEITSTLDLDEVLAIVLRALERVLGFQYSMVLLKDLAESKLRVFASRGYDPSGVGAEVALGHGVLGVVAERKRMLRVGNIGATVAYLGSIRARMEAAGDIAPGGDAPALPGLAKAQSQLALPLLVKDR